MTPEKEQRFFTVIISAKDVRDFVKQHPRDWANLQRADEHYSIMRERAGRKAHNSYIICNQDEPYAEKVWQVILEGERAKLEPLKSDLSVGTEPTEKKA